MYVGSVPLRWGLSTLWLWFWCAGMVPRQHVMNTFFMLQLLPDRPIEGHFSLEGVRQTLSSWLARTRKSDGYNLLQCRQLLIPWNKVRPVLA